MSMPAADANLVYKTVDSHDVHLEVWLPTSKKASSAPVPVVVYTHGGGFIDGSSSDVTPLLLLPALSRDIAFVSIDYRLAPQVTVQDQLSDLSSACSYVSSGALDKALGGSKVDGSRLGLVGSSAGAFLALFGGYTKIKPRAIFDLYGVTTLDVPSTPTPFPYKIEWDEVKAHLDDNVRVVSHAPVSLDMQTFVAGDRTRACFYTMQEGTMIASALGKGQLDPKDFVVYEKIEPSSAPTVIVHGKADMMVPFGASQALYESLKKAGVDAELIPVEGANHIFDGPPESYEDEKNKEAFEKAYDFLKKYL